MKTRTLILLLILVLASIFAFLTVRLTNYNLRRTFRASSQNAFYLLSFVVDHYLNNEKQVEEAYVERLRNEISVQSTGKKPSISVRDSSLFQGMWVIAKDATFGVTEHEEIEQEIMTFHQRNLAGKNEHSLIIIEGKPFILVNTKFKSGDILLLSQAKVISGIRIEQVLDSLISSSYLRYFAILNANNTPILFSTLYENFLPLKGPGQYIIDTPEGSIFQIEEQVDDHTIVAGFEMQSLNKILMQNNIFLVLIIGAFVMLEGILLASYWRFQRFKLKKERELKKFKEVSALSTGFGHEFGNYLHTISLLAKELEEENRSILLDEMNRMKAIMDSLRLLSTKNIELEEIRLVELVNESVSLLGHIIKEKNIIILQEVRKDVVIKGNRPLLVTALSNILKNSIEAHARNIKINTHKKGKRLRIDFADDGRGIDPAITGQIFEPFFSAKGQSGIGLYLTKSIVELHGGEIELTRNDHIVFSVTLPI